MTETWLDKTTGDLLVGQAAVTQALEQSLAGDIVPLSQVLIAREFDIDTSAYDHQRPQLTGDEYSTYGKWLVGILKSDPAFDGVLRRHHLERPSKLLLGPGERKLHEAFGKYSIRAMAIEFGLPHFSARGTYENWTMYDFVMNADRLASQLGRKPTKEDYIEWASQGLGPHPYVIFRKIAGGISAINDAIGYPDIKSWSEEDYVDWGARFMRANGSLLPTNSMVGILAQRNRGPSAKTIRAKFGSFAKFNHFVEEAYDSGLYATPEKHRFTQEQYRSIVESAETQNGVNKNSKDYQATIARYELIRACLPTLAAKKASRLALATIHKSIVEAIREQDPSLTAGHIEAQAVAYDLFDTIWPQFNSDQHLVINEDELKHARSRKAKSEYQRRLRLRSTATQPSQAA